MYNAQFVSALKEALNGLRTIHSVGEEWCSYIGKIPTGGVPYCGQEVTRETYSALWSYAQAQGLVKSESEWQSWASSHGGNVPYYSSGNGSSTFRMPKIVGYIKGASSQSEAGMHLFEGLPNITGWFTSASQKDNASGAFSTTTTSKRTAKSGTDSNFYQTNFDASKSNPIYGNSDHVTPETSVVMFGVYAFGAIVETGALDATTLATALARVESNLDAKLEKTTVHIVETWQSGASWYRKWSDGFIEQGGRVSITSSADVAVTFFVAFSGVSYCDAESVSNTANYWGISTVLGGSITNTGMTVTQRGRDGNRLNGVISWYACGY